MRLSDDTINTAQALKQKRRNARREKLKPLRSDINAYIEHVLNREGNPPLEQCQLNLITQEFITKAFAAGKHPLIMLPMGTGKTVQSYARLAYEIGNDSNLTSMVVTSAYTTAKQRVSTIEQILLSGEHTGVFPESQPDYKRGWSDATGLYLKRTKIAPDPTVRGTGIIGQYTGARLDFILLDDVVDLDNTILRNTQSYIIDKTKTSLFSRLYKDGHIVVIGTPYTNTDLYHNLMDNDRFCWLRCPIASDFSGLEVYSKGLKMKLPDIIPLPSYADEQFMRQRKIEVGYAAWQRGYRLSPVVSTERWYQNLDKAFIVENLPMPVATGFADAVIIQGVDLAGKTRKGTAIVTLLCTAREAKVIDAEFHAGGIVERKRAIVAAGRKWNVDYQIVESNFQQQEMIDFVRDEVINWSVISHQTGTNKWDPVTGVEMMDTAFECKELMIYCGPEDYEQRNPATYNALQGIMRLIEELRIAPAMGTIELDGKKEITELDGVMATWFAWRYWLQKIRGYDNSEVLSNKIKPGGRIKHAGRKKRDIY